MPPEPRPRSVLLLAGTAEAADLARRLAADPLVEVTASLAGRTRSPAPFPCPVRTGGFGGVDGLVSYLRGSAADALVDATHPFAAMMPHHAAAAARTVGVPRLRLLRPAWLPSAGDRWIEVDDLPAAADVLIELGARRVLLTTGRLELAPFARFAALEGTHVLVRSIEPPDPLALPSATVLLDRGPYTVEGETALLREHGVDAVVTKNSGGEATAAKLAAARACDVPVVMVRRPPQPAGPVATTVEEAVAWLAGV